VASAIRQDVSGRSISHLERVARGGLPLPTASPQTFQGPRTAEEKSDFWGASWCTRKSLEAWLEQRTQDKSINFVEVGLIAEFEKATPKGAPPGPRFDTLLPITLTVRGMHRKQGDAMSTTSTLSFPVGTVLAMGKTIVFFRIQDHLRNMGLGREALKALYRIGLEDLDIDEDSPDAKRIRDLFASIKGRR
jgi:hypothetical protein